MRGGRVIVVGGVVWTMIAVGAACSSFSGSGDTLPDAGGLDATTSDVPSSGEETSIADAGSDDADSGRHDVPFCTVTSTIDSGVLYCDSFEDPLSTSCGSDWFAEHATGTVTLMTDGGRSGDGFCRLCATSNEASLKRVFAFAGPTSYLLTGWVRMITRPAGTDASDWKVTPQLIVYDAPTGGTQLEGKSDQKAYGDSTEWRFLNVTVGPNDGGVREEAFFFPAVFATNNGYCIDLDDVKLTTK